VSEGSVRKMSGRTGQGYAMVAAAYLLVGLSGTLVAWATAPASVLLVLRFAVSSVVLGLLFARRHRLAGVVARDVWPRLLLMGAIDAATLLLFFVAVRQMGVAIATFLYFMQPVWVALLAPRVLGSATEWFVYVAIGVALAGLVTILLPAVAGEGAHVTALGVVAGFACGVGYACFAVLVKSLSERLESVTLVLAECVLDTLFLLPLALWALLGTRYSLTGRDLLAALTLGTVCTAVAYSLWMEGTSRVRMQHSAVLGFLTPVAAPFFALVLLGQTVSGWTIAGGAFILAAGLLVAVRGQVGLEEEPPL
jgi:drug/metabolite transporter (DMT)-like permease